MTSEPWQPPDPQPNEDAVDIGPDEAEEFAERVGPDPTPQQVEEYVHLQERVEPPD